MIYEVYMEKKYHDLVNYDEIKESVDFWNSPMIPQQNKNRNPFIKNCG